MKIGILTFYDVVNFGAVLQAYALQKKIESLGFETEFIRISTKQRDMKVKKGLALYFKVLKNNKFSIASYLRTRNVDHIKYDLFRDFKERFMNVSRISYRDIEQLKARQSEYDAFVTGSDMVWSDIGQNLDVYFLTFAPENKRLSYAPSLTGRDGESQNDRIKYKEWLEGISFLSCREKYGQKYIENLIGKKARLVADPTLLFTKEEWKSNLNLNTSQEKKYILCYFFQGITKDFRRKLNDYAYSNDLDVKYIPMTAPEVKHNLQNGFDTAIGPKEFVDSFYNASFVITNSFHGLLFSLIMNKPFYLLHRGEGNEWVKHEERMINILQITGLEERFIHEKEIPSSWNFNVDYGEVNKKIDEFRIDSIEYLKEALSSVSEDKEGEERSYNRISDLEDDKCTGCSACVNSCPVNAIEMFSSREGFLFPRINEDVCCNCGLCSKKCPQINPVQFLYPVQTFCGIGNNELIKNSASGGAFVTFAKFIIENLRGAVYGAVLQMPEGKIEHIEVTSLNQLSLLQNSKYVQSDIRKVLTLCKNRLEAGEMVLFSGTPCQIAGLKRYLGRDYENLLTVDLICHGVPSPMFLKLYIDNEIPTGVKELKFRHRYEAEKRRSAFDISFEKEGKVKIIPGVNDLYYGPFLSAESYRESCYECQYAREERVADITIGDCDSYKYYLGLEKNNIISSILINTEKGKELWNSCKHLFIFSEMNYKEESYVNHQLRRPVTRPERRNYIYKSLENGWYEYKKKNRVKDGLERKIKRLIIRLMGN